MLRFGGCCRRIGVDPRYTIRMTDSETPRVDYVCERCGGAAVTRDAWAEWDAEAQAWVPSAIFDFAFCHQCHRETRLSERPLTNDGGPPVS